MIPEKSLPQWLPADVRQYMERGADLLQSTPFHDLYAPVRRLIFDDSLMPEIWSRLDQKEMGLAFLLSLINDISFWGMKDKTTPTESKILYEQVDKSLSRLVQAMASSADLQFDCQQLFELAVFDISGQKITKAIKVNNTLEVNVVHFLDVLQKIRSGLLEIKNDREMAPEHTSSLYPRKMNEKSSFRTYLARCVYRSLEGLSDRKNLKTVADVLQVMLDDPEGISEDHLRKILKS